jgi:hypothetical protein
LLVALTGGSASGSPAVWFEEAAAARGLSFVHVSGNMPGRYLFPEIHAGGAALFDADGDGDLDAYLVQSGGLTVPAAERPGNRLYLNRGDGSFEDATEGSGAADRGFGMGVAAGDFDGDGKVDLYVTNVGPNVLLRNLGGGRFEDVSARAGVGADGWGSSAAFLDYDLDGDLDLFAANYINWSADDETECFDATGRRTYCGPANYNSPAVDVLYRNEGDGRFTDVTVESRMSVAFGTGLGVTTGDFDGNGWPDLFVANDNMLDQLWLNQGDGTFREEAIFRGCAADSSGKPKAGMGVAAADVDDDGDLDLMVCNLTGESDSLFLNDGGYFADRTGASGLAAVSRALTRFGLGWVDFDNDGVLDVYEANGAIARQGRIFLDSDPFAEPNLLIRGRPGPRYEEVLPRGGTAELLVATSRAAAFGDVDGDGGIDVLVVNRDAPAYLLINRVPNRGGFLRVRVILESGADALGATVWARFGGHRVSREVRAAYSYQASNDPVAHFGLGSAAKVDGLEVLWPDGRRRCLGEQAANRLVTVGPSSGSACD